ncbi:hypothetical protein OEIGOIKO_05846 [Streptomyces chrestomyceticus JCM 4735]|uniref:Uncharacterized protein n=2 Tax=Streptomyces chrestomyceticus TaxID=68185 RepID=A0A7U9KZ32_9ACTN|nr:hypothetical protein OEIGOIKO_05846 [Streptomyces chrestomyceticus JCM 4735]
MRVEVVSVTSMPLDVCVYLRKRAHAWVLYILQELLDHLGGVIPGLVITPPVITARWLVSPGR